MTTLDRNYPDLPMSTMQASKNLFIAPFNQAIGDQMDVITEGVDFSGLGLMQNRANTALVILAMATILQAVEFLPDNETAEMMGKRMDWKYALHLPIHFPGLEPEVLHDFRYELMRNEEGLQIFQSILDRLTQLGLLGCRKQQNTRALDLLNSICALNQITNLTDAMSRLLEALSAEQPDWLRENFKPHWFCDYKSEVKSIAVPYQREQQLAMEKKITADISHLLDALNKTNDPAIFEFPEIREIRNLIDERSAAQSEMAH